MAKLGNLQAKILLDTGTGAQVVLGGFEIPLVVQTKPREGKHGAQRVEVDVAIPKGAVKAALRAWAVEMAEALA